MMAMLAGPRPCRAVPGVPPEPPLADESQPEDRPDKRFPPHVTWKHFSRTVRKLPSDRLTVLLQGQGADLWAGTVDAGLLRAREASIAHFPPQDEGLPASPLTALAEDGDGGIWVGTAGRGLAHFNRETWHRADVHDGLPSNRVTSLLRHDKELFVGTDAGLVEWSLENRPGKTWTRRDGFWSPEVSALAPRSDGRLWVGTREGLGILDVHGDFERVAAAGPPWITSLLGIEKLEMFGFAVVVTGSPAGMVVRKADEPEVLVARLGVEQGLPDGRITSMAAPSGLVRYFWVATDGGGLAQIEVRKDHRDKPFFEIHPITPGPGSYPDGRIQSLVCDKDRVWLASSSGGLSEGTLQKESQDTTATGGSAGGSGQTSSSVAAGSATSSAAATHAPTCTTAERLNWNIMKMPAGWRVIAMAQAQGQLWVGFMDRGAAVGAPPLCEWVFYPRVTDGHGGTRLYVRPQPTSVAAEYNEAGLGGGSVGDIAVDNDGSVWFATWDMGLSHRDGKDFLPLAAKEGVPSRRVRSLLADRPTGDLYAIASNDQGHIYDDPNDETASEKIHPKDLVLRRSGGEWTILPLGPGPVVKEMEFTCVYPLARDGKLYLGTTHGLHEFDGRVLKPSKKRMAVIDLRSGKPVPVDEKTQRQMAEAAVWSLFETVPGILGICTDAGVFLDDGSYTSRIPGTDGLTSWSGSYDQETRMIYFLGARHTRWTAGSIPFRKGQLWRYQPELGMLKGLVSETNCYVVTPTSVWYSRHPIVGEIKPKPMR
ncbi:MAG: hypothetical protein HY303_18300 [Candidatus Wallbacteria bacterium]|nr:hypothetical protein [Candidatus Wallbacteria bacterium]